MNLLSGIRWRPGHLTLSCKRSWNLWPRKPRWCQRHWWSHSPVAASTHCSRCLGWQLPGQPNAWCWHSQSSGEVRLLAGRMPLASCPCLLSADQPLPLCSRGAWCFCSLPSGRARPVLLSTEAAASRRDGGQSREDARALGSHELGPGSGSAPIGGLWASNSKPFKPHFLPLSKEGTYLME